MKATFSNYNCDNNLNLHKKIVWLFRNLFVNVCFFTKTRYKIKSFNHKNLELKKEINLKSPSRFLCDKFWETKMSDLIDCKKGITILEVGCGSGTYGSHFNNILGSKLIKYIGVDLYSFDEWDSFGNKFEFHKLNSKDIYESIKHLKIDLIVTQSAIEHFDEDLTFFKGLKKYKDNNPKTKQLHLFPARKGIYLYLFHGVRQYNLRNINKIAKIFNFNIELYAMGSLILNFLHLIFITMPVLFLRVDLRSKFPKTYSLLLRRCMQSKFLNNSKYNTVFYALFIK
jgi:SAM-dependent methyltransferase